ncbi:hypothetical protein [Lysinibacillus fusiformis]|uniref:hypothetical protein n=1 Tax=Lysinibacillus fusiformis TaxID=28031 RepID=UPI0021C113C6|nr:hypothetical protein [Lysinibacillus fusiformis]UXJ71401.1 hypothetical protein N5069_23550 [Lysinibacillus fusiformis]
MMNNEPVMLMVKYIQMVLTPVSAIGFIIGLFIFIIMYKNPMRRRTAFLITVMSPIMFMFLLYGVVMICYYTLDGPIQDVNNEGLWFFEGFINSKLSGGYHVFKIILRPLLILAVLIGMGILHHGSGIPGRKRMGTGILFGFSLIWLLLEIGPSIYTVLSS